MIRDDPRRDANVDAADDDLQIAVITAGSPLMRRLARLTASEAAVARFVLDGLSNQEIAARRGVSVRTVDGQIQDIFRRFAVRDRGELAWALVGPDEPREPGPRRCPRIR